MAVTERQSEIAQMLRKQFSGNLTLEEIYNDTITGAVTFLRAMEMFFREKLGDSQMFQVTQDSVLWEIVDGALRTLPPKTDLPPVVKWYVIKYEQYVRDNWYLTKLLMDKLKSIDDEKPFNEVVQDEKFLEFFSNFKSLEDQINARLEKDGLAKLESDIWSENETTNNK